MQGSLASNSSEVWLASRQMQSKAHTGYSCNSAMSSGSAVDIVPNASSGAAAGIRPPHRHFHQLQGRAELVNGRRHGVLLHQYTEGSFHCNLQQLLVLCGANGCLDCHNDTSNT
jgi:hypothetical protein